MCWLCGIEYEQTTHNRRINEMKGILAILMAGIMIAAMIAPAMSEDAETSVSIGNAPPGVCAKWEEPDDDPTTSGVQVLPNASPDVKTVTIKACVCDPNGESDIASVAADVTGPTGFTPVTVTLTRNTSMDCSGHSCPTGTVDCIGYDGTFDMRSCDPAGNYTVIVTVTDQADATGTMENTFEYLSLIAMTAGDVAFGSVAPGGSGTASSTVTCTGNAEIEFVDAAPANYDNPDDADGISWTDMTSAAADVIDDGQLTTTWAQATTVTCGNSADVPFTLDVPAGTPSGTYAGTITFTPTAV
jgi:hypothetical protein